MMSYYLKKFWRRNLLAVISQIVVYEIGRAHV